MFSELETITPEKAKQYLERNPNNRNLRPTRVDQLAAMMKNGHWRLTHQGIAFNCDGTLRDGQHRLAAIIKANVPVTILVTRGLQDDAMLYIDTSMPRSEADAFTIWGFPATKTQVAIGRVMWLEYRAQHYGASWTSQNMRHCDRDTLLKFIQYHWEAINFAKSNALQKGVSHACVRAAFACAWWTRDRELLQRFMDQLADGVVDDPRHDSAVIRLRDWLMQAPILGGAMRHEVFGRTCTALDAYLDRRGIKKLFWRASVKFPLPE